MKIRLNKFLSQRAVVSRREADRLITEGQIQVNNRLALDLGLKIDPERDVVSVDGRQIKENKKFVYALLNKPPGYLVTLKDPFRRPTVRDLLPASLGRLFPVGRLDFDSQGLLLLTNDGELAFRLSHPRFEVEKVYLVKVKGEPGLDSLRRLERGVFLDGQKTAPAKVKLLAHNPKSSLFRREIHEGRKREVRRMCQAVGHKVLELKRIGFAGLSLKNLKPGRWRLLLPSEIKRLRKLVKLTS